MSTLLPELAKENAESNRRVLLSVEKEAQLLDRMRQAEAEEASLRRKISRSARETMQYTLSRATDTGDLWKFVVARFEEGLSGDKPKNLLCLALEVFDSWLALKSATDRLRRIAESVGATLEGTEELEQAASEAQRLKKAASDMLAFLNRPHPPIDLERLKKGMEGRMALLADLQAGELVTPIL